MDTDTFDVTGNMNAPVSTSARRPLLPPCRVCGGKASGFHYGVNSCEACKGFFRRSLSRSHGYLCQRNNECQILPGKRNNCPACRMKKCQSTGMSKSAIRTGRYSYEVHTQYIEEVKSMETKSSKFNDSLGVSPTSSSSVSSSSPRCVPHLGGTFPEFPLAQGFGSSPGSTPDSFYSPSISGSSMSTSPLSSDASISSGPDLLSNQNLCSNYLPNGIYPKEELPDVNNYYHGQFDKHFTVKTTVDNADGLQYSDEENAHHLNKLMSAQDGLNEDLDAFLDELHMERRKNEYLAEKEKVPDATLPERVENANLSEEDQARIAKMQQVAETMDSELRNMMPFIKIIPGWKAIHMEDQIALIRESAVELWLIGHYQCMDATQGTFTGEFNTTREESTEIYSDEYLACLYQTGQMFQKLKLKKEEVIVLKAIILTFTDRCNLVNKSAVEGVQLRMVECFRYVCKLLGSDFNKRFATIIDKLITARELSEKFKSVVVAVISHWEILDKYPLLKEFFGGYKSLVV